MASGDCSHMPSRIQDRRRGLRGPRPRRGHRRGRHTGRDEAPGARETYRVLEGTHLLAGSRRSDPPLAVRRILVHSTGSARGQQRARDKRLAKVREDLDNFLLSAGGRFDNTAESSPHASA